MEGAEKAELKVAAILGASGAIAPKKAAITVAPRIEEGQISVLVGASTGDYRSGDEIWCDTLSQMTMRTRSTAMCSSPAPPAAFCSAD